MAVKIRIKDYHGYGEIECDQNPLGKKAMCWACQLKVKCEPYQKLKQEAKEEYEKRLEGLIRLVEERLKGMFDMGYAEIVESGHEVCRECPEKPKECQYCQNDPQMFHQFKKPYIKVLIRG